MTLLALTLAASAAANLPQQPEVPQQTQPPPAAAAAPDSATSINFGLGAYSPANEPYKPLTGAQRWELWVNNNFKNPRNYARCVLFTIPEHTSNKPPQWGQGWDAYGVRVGSRFARLTLSASLHYGIAAAIGHDPRYIACRGTCGTWKRLRHAFLYEFVTYNRTGKAVFNISSVAGQLSSEAIAGTWLPDRSVGHQVKTGVVEQLTFAWVANVVKEFAPEIKRVVRKVRKK